MITRAVSQIGQNRSYSLYKPIAHLIDIALSVTFFGTLTAVFALKKLAVKLSPHNTEME
jgi:hypothetical protein